jgi:hypothetical protein
MIANGPNSLEMVLRPVDGVAFDMAFNLLWV